MKGETATMRTCFFKIAAFTLPIDFSVILRKQLEQITGCYIFRPNLFFTTILYF